MAKLIARYSALALPASNQMSKMKPDATGYYKVVLGAFDTCNEHGLEYPLTEAVKFMFGPGGSVTRKIEKRLFKSEMNHPDLSQCKTKAAVLNRVRAIDTTRVCSHTKAIDLVQHKDEYGKPLVLAVGLVKPTGPYGPGVKTQFDNPEENIAYSVRAISLPARSARTGGPARLITEIPAYDFVDEPGISAATQFMVANLESLQPGNIGTDFIFDNDDLEEAIALNTNIGFEEEATSLTRIRTSLGWEKIQVVNLGVLSWK